MEFGFQSVSENVTSDNVLIEPLEEGTDRTFYTPIVIAKYVDSQPFLLVRTNGEAKWLSTSLLERDASLASSFWIATREVGLGISNAAVRRDQTMLISRNTTVSLMPLEWSGTCIEGAAIGAAVENGTVEICGPNGSRFKTSTVLLGNQFVPLASEQALTPAAAVQL